MHGVICDMCGVMCLLSDMKMLRNSISLVQPKGMRVSSRFNTQLMRADKFSRIFFFLISFSTDLGVCEVIPYVYLMRYCFFQLKIFFTRFQSLNSIRLKLLCQLSFMFQRSNKNQSSQTQKCSECSGFFLLFFLNHTSL